MGNEYRLHGPPGTGKTWTLATVWVPRAAERFGPDRVVICSLTRAAARVIAGRDHAVPKENIGTLHALCYRALDKPEIAESHLDEWAAKEPTLALSYDEPEKPSVSPYSERKASTKGDTLMAEVQALRHRLTPFSRWPRSAQVFYSRWRAWLEDTGRVDFTGLIEEALDGISTAPGQPRVLIVDEAQDCSALELALVRKWGERAAYTVLAGDGDQAIYAWRGASPQAFLGSDIPPEHNYHLSQSHRVPAEVHRVARAWIGRCSSRYAVEYTSSQSAGEVLRRTDITSRYPVMAARLAEQEASEGRSVMILAACAYSLRATVRELRARALPFHNPYRASEPTWNPIRGGAAALRDFLRIDPRLGRSARLWSWDELSRWTDALGSVLEFAKGWKARARTISDAYEGSQRAATPILPSDGAAVFGEDGWELLRSLFTDGTAATWFAERAKAKHARSVAYASLVASKHGTSALIEPPKIIVGTVHSTKGGEADSVFLFPDLSSSGMKEWLQPGEHRDGVIRLFYVGMTRARCKLVLCGASSPRAVDWPTSRMETPTA